jgi:ATP-dependent RNA helicase DDX5/DBP2
MAEGMDSYEDKKVKKAALKKEAEKLGISYEEMKKRDKKRGRHNKKSEADALESDEHKAEVKRMRAYSTDGDDVDVNEKRLRTRSMDKAEENQAVIKEEKSLSTDEWRKEHTLTLRGHGESRDLSSLSESVTKPYIEFADSPFSQRIIRSLTGAGFARPMPIQAQAWPLAVAGKDLISIAKTGSGKTCGFLLPVFHHHEMEQQQKDGGQRYRGPGNPPTKPILLVLAPTRELSVQILEEAQKFGRPLGIRSVCCYGGAPKYPQIAALQRGVECIIACPGRLNDLIEMKKADLSGIKYLVLDEADRMLDMVSMPCLESLCSWLFQSIAIHIRLTLHFLPNFA